MEKWPDRSGSMRYRPERVESAETEGSKAISDIVARVHALDLVIEKFAYALELIQPSAPGKIAIRFLKRPFKGASGRHPTFIQWYRSPDMQFRYVRYKPAEILRRVKTTTLFQPSMADVRELIQEVRPLIERREKLLETLHSYERVLKSASTRALDYARKSDEEIERWLPLILEKTRRLWEDWQDWIQAADEQLPDDLVADEAEEPRIAPGGMTRAHIHPTHRKQVD